MAQRQLHHTTTIETDAVEVFGSAFCKKLFLKYDAGTQSFSIGIGLHIETFSESDFLDPVPSTTVKELLQTLQSPPEESTTIALNDANTLVGYYCAGHGLSIIDRSGKTPDEAGVMLKDLPALIAYFTACLAAEVAHSKGPGEPHFGLEAYC